LTPPVLIAATDANVLTNAKTASAFLPRARREERGKHNALLYDQHSVLSKRRGPQHHDQHHASCSKRRWKVVKNDTGKCTQRIKRRARHQNRERTHNVWFRSFDLHWLSFKSLHVAMFGKLFKLASAVHLPTLDSSRSA
jgi:hypothetical protein